MFSVLISVNDSLVNNCCGPIKIIGYLTFVHPGPYVIQAGMTRLCQDYFKQFCLPPVYFAFHQMLTSRCSLMGILDHQLPVNSTNSDYSYSTDFPDVHCSYCTDFPDVHCSYCTDFPDVRTCGKSVRYKHGQNEWTLAQEHPYRCS